jgi:putative ABC transport system permease protein
MWSSVFRDLRFGVRVLARQWTFTVLSVATLALGIGAATTIFSVIEAVLFDPFDFDADRMVTIGIQNPKAGNQVWRSAFQVPELLDYQAHVSSFEAVIAGMTEPVLYTTPDGVEQFSGGRTSANTFSVLGVPPLLGRTLDTHDADPGAEPVFVLTYKTWQQYFGGDPAVIGKQYVLDGVSTTLVGVMGPRFRKLGADLYRPAILDRADPERSQTFYQMQARLRRGVTESQAAAEMQAVAQNVARTYPQFYPEQFRIRVVSMLEAVIGSFRLALYFFAASVGLLLLIACVNVANLLLARATVREREMALRASLGATRFRLVRQMLVETTLLGLLGGILGCGVAYVAIDLLVKAMPPFTIPQQAVIRLNTPVLIFCLGIALVTSLACGLVPALRSVGKDLVEPLKDSGKGAGSGFRHRRLADALVAAEVALSIVLLVCAGLLVRSFVKMQDVDLGFDPKNLGSAFITFQRGQFQTAEGRGQLMQQILTRLQAMPGVTAATVVSNPPPFGPRIDFDVPGHPTTEKQFTALQLCSEGYFRTVGQRLLRGRALSEADISGARKVAVVNQTLATRFFGDESPLGHTVTLAGLAKIPATLARVSDPSFEIIGVVSDTRNEGLREPTMPEVFVPHTITAAFGRAIVVRTIGSTAAVMKDFKREAWAVNRGITMMQPELVTNQLDLYFFAQARLGVIIIGTFAAAGLMLVAAGVFSVIAYAVSRRTHEIGIRMALGAQRGDVLGMMLGTSTKVIGIGIAIGIAGSLLVARVLARELYQIAPQDPLTMAVVIAVVMIVGLVATYVPARYATRVDPMIALRHE